MAAGAEAEGKEALVLGLIAACVEDGEVVGERFVHLKGAVAVVDEAGGADGGGVVRAGVTIYCGGAHAHQHGVALALGKIDGAALGAGVLDDALEHVDAEVGGGGLEAGAGDVELVQDGVDRGGLLRGGGHGENGGQTKGGREALEENRQAHWGLLQNCAGEDGCRRVGEMVQVHSDGH